MIAAMNEALEACYAREWGELNRRIARVQGASQPFLIRIPEAYQRASMPLMIVGQETFGWGTSEDRRLESVRELTDLHAAFDLGRGYRATPFWRGAHELNRKLNPEQESSAFLWSNLVRVDCNKRRPPADLEEYLTGLEWLNTEIEVARPSVLVFFTGPSYDERLNRQFAGMRSESLARALMRLTIPGFHGLAFRTYHPKYLALSRQWGILDEIVAHATAPASD